MFCHGSRVGFYQGDISLLMDDIKTLKPTFFPVVPRVLNRIYDKVRIRFKKKKKSVRIGWCLIILIFPMLMISMRLNIQFWIIISVI